LDVWIDVFGKDSLLTVSGEYRTVPSTFFLLWGFFRRVLKKKKKKKKKSYCKLVMLALFSLPFVLFLCLFLFF
jgi:hypothetical protein